MTTKKAKVVSLCGARLDEAVAQLHPRALEAGRAKEMLSHWAGVDPRGFVGVVIQHDGRVTLVGSMEDDHVTAILLTKAAEVAREVAYETALKGYGIDPEDDDGFMDIDGGPEDA